MDHEATAGSTGGTLAETAQPLIDVVFEDDHLIVVVKPSGLVMHPGYRHPDGTLWNILAAMFVARGLAEPPNLLHRLDRDTSGLVCVPKHLRAHRRLERDLRAGRFEKQYLALVEGRMPLVGTIETPLGRDDVDRRRMCVREDGQQARTHYTALRRFEHVTLLRVRLETGRMHQIRVHLASIGHPVAGDCVYGHGEGSSDRLFLHADRLAFPHPLGRQRIACRAPLPPELHAVLCRACAP